MTDLRPVIGNTNYFSAPEPDRSRQQREKAAR